MKKWSALFWVLTQYIILSTASATPPTSQIDPLTDAESLITLLATNDIHGGIDGKFSKGDQVGGLAYFSGVVRSIRKGLENKFGSKAGVLVLDAGDQFQGTLISNYTEGDLIFSAMNHIGYDAAVPGNHDFDFGPKGWLEDRVATRPQDQNPREVIEKLAKKALFPLLSANTYIKSSIIDTEGRAVAVNGVRCQVLSHDSSLPNWGRAKRPDSFEPYIIKTIANVRVALIGLDNPETPQITTAENVSDLCFRDEAKTYQEIRNELEGKADIFVLILHNGDSNTSHTLTQLLTKLTSKPNQVHAVISGHTHFVMSKFIRGVPFIQSGSGGDRFGRIDLIWNHHAHAIDGRRIRSFAGIRLSHHRCDSQASSFCSIQSGTPAYEDVPVEVDSKIEAEVQSVQKTIRPLANRKLGYANSLISRNRTSESALANLLTDAFREMTQADISFLNTGGLRANIDPGQITYEKLFQVLPFNNHAVEIGPMSWSKILSLLEKSVQTCGSYGALMQSGLKVEFTRNCRQAVEGIDHQARVEQVRSLQDEILYDRQSEIQSDPNRLFRVATLDFLATGGSAYHDFLGTPILQDFGVFREKLADQLESHPSRWKNEIDQRWIELESFN